ncbi:MAG: hypothetical protein ACR2K3_01320 [Nocardioides sp.]
MTSTGTASYDAVDPFDLPEWLGDQDVTWTPQTGMREGHLVAGDLTAGDHLLGCDLLAIDEAYPAPVADDGVRLRAHQAWRNGEVLLIRYADRLTLAVPGTRFNADLGLDALSRLARAVGSSPGRYAALLKIGTERPRGGSDR